MKNLFYTASMFMAWAIMVSTNAVAGNTPSLAFLQKVSSELNKGLPQRIDNDIELRSTYAQIGAFGYMFVFINYNAGEADSELFLAKQSPQVKNFACTNPRMKRFFDDNVDVIYSYYGKDMKHVVEIVVTSNDCKKYE
jgi:hypothetical protein